MAEFRPFDLGQVIQTAEGIKAMRAQSTTDRLREAYLGEQIQGMRDDRSRQQQMDQLVLGKEKAQQIVAKTGQILQQKGRMKNYVEQYEPDLVKNLSANGVDWATVDEDSLGQMVTAMQNQANQELGVAPLESQEINGATVITQGGNYKNSFTPHSATDKNPSSYDEFMLSQKDPEFARFLQSRRGKGLSVTLPDGTTVEMGGAASGVGPGELSKPTVNSLQETIVNSQNRLDRLNATLSTYKPEYLRARGMIDANTTKLKDFVGMDVSPEDKQFLQGYTEFRANSANDFNQILKELSGTAVSHHEMPRLRQSMPSANDTPAEFEAKARAATKFVSRAIMRANWALKNGIGVNSVDELAKRMPLEGIDGVFEARANQIWQDLGGTPETRQRAIQMANQEFGVAR